MKKKGFTLVELLAVIAILAILVIMALPAVLRMFKQSKVNTFQNEVKGAYRTAQQQFVNDSLSLNSGGKVVYTNGCDSVNGATVKRLEITGDSNFKYYIEVGADGKIKSIKASNGSYSYIKTGNDLKIDEIMVENGNGVELDSNIVDNICTATSSSQSGNSGSNSSATDESYFTYNVIKSSVTYDIDIPTCISYVEENNPKRIASEYCNSEIELDINSGDISPRDYANYGISNVVNTGTVKITGYNSEATGVTYNINMNTCKNFMINEMGYEEQDAINYCDKDSGESYTIEQDLMDTHISSANYSNYGLSNVNIITTGPKDIVIPSTINGLTVTEIGSYAFESKALTSVVIPNTVTRINDSAFTTNNISSLTIGSGVTTIKYNSFSSNSLTSVTIPSSVRVLEGQTCWQANHNMTRCASGAFTGNQLTSVTIQGKSSSSDFDTYTEDIWGWDPDVTCVKDNTSNVSNGCITWGS